ncbi:hypothetical protein ZIOFF_036302 [Zingiber officinale]|uniref:Uncharacterized protein n=1 Tax=Zingiber officinale TaxID=94328 RepID=A0A8J5KYH1_ZINOF|nr:hypothetical protein ZIOFF_036302 [Zingiber officinale]
MAPATAFLLPLLSSVILLAAAMSVRASPPGPVVTCRSGNSNCTVTNAYGTFPDRSTCLVASVAYPGTEQELQAAVSVAAAKGQHMKALSAYSHSIPKLSCPCGPAGRGLVISTVRLNRTVTLQLESMFKRSIKNKVIPDVAFENSISSFTTAAPYSDNIWYPSQAKVIYRDDFKLPISAPGTGLNDFIGLRA